MRFAKTNPVLYENSRGQRVTNTAIYLKKQGFVIFISCLTVLILGWQVKNKLILWQNIYKADYNLVALFLGIIGLVLGNSHQKETQLDL